jgi:hypothetical protein
MVGLISNPRKNHDCGVCNEILVAALLVGNISTNCWWIKIISH